MPNSKSQAADTQVRRTRRLLAAAMAAPVLFQLALHALASLWPFEQAQGYAHLLVYAASGAAAAAGCVLVARLEAARSLLVGRNPPCKD